MKLISEEVLDAQYIVEENEGKKEYKIRGIFYSLILKTEMVVSTKTLYYQKK
jgi:hypothetical protein